MSLLQASLAKGLGIREQGTRSQESQRVLADVHWGTWERSRAWRLSGSSRAGWAETGKYEVGLEAALSKGESTARGSGRGSSW